MVEVTIDGLEIHSERDLHRCLAESFDFGDYYGANLAALRDRLLIDVPRPVRLIWRCSDVSRERLGDVLFARITAILDEVERQDVEFGWSDRFEYFLA